MVINTFLIGSYFMQSENLFNSLEAFRDKIITDNANSSSKTDVGISRKDRGIFVKICGITNIEDAVAAAKAGADVVGFILSTDSKRKIGFEEAVEIVVHTRKKFKVDFAGVFVNEKFEFIKKFLNAEVLDFIQLAGDENLNFIKKIKTYKPDIKIIKSIKVKKESKKKDIYEQLLNFNYEKNNCLIDFFILDTFNNACYGGTGCTFNWKIIEGLSKDFPIILAGGLDKSNVSLAIKTARPSGVDCSSGVEICEGKKDIKKMMEFIKNAKRN